VRTCTTRAACSHQVSDELKRHYGEKVFDTGSHATSVSRSAFVRQPCSARPAFQGRARAPSFARELLGATASTVKEPHDKHQGLGRVSTRCRGEQDAQRRRACAARGELVAPRQVPAANAHGEASLAELAQSIKARGVISRFRASRGRERVRDPAGERRWRAAKMRISSAFRGHPRSARRGRARIGLIENISARPEPHRGGRGLKRLIDEFSLTHEEVARPSAGRARRDQLASPSRARAAGAGDGAGRPNRHGPCARATRVVARAPGRARAADRRQGPLGA